MLKESSEPLPCPFCGVEMNQDCSNLNNVWHPHTNCILRGEYFDIEIWNTRATDSRLVEVIRAIEVEKRRGATYTNDPYKCGQSYALTQALKIIYQFFPESNKTG